MKMRSFYKKIPFFIYKKLPIVIYKKLNAPNSNLKKIQFLGRIYTPGARPLGNSYTQNFFDEIYYVF